MNSFLPLFSRSKVITVLLADDHTLLRQGLRALIAMEKDIRVVGEASTGREAVSLVEELHPDVVIMDIGMPALNGIEATRQIMFSNPKTKVMMLTAHSEDDYIKHAIEAGAAGYLVKQTCAKDLIGSIRELDQGGRSFSSSVARRLNLDFKSPVNRSASFIPTVAQLTPREAEVIQLIAEGRANKQVAGELCISIKTVEKHRQNLMNKLAIHETAGLTRYAIAEGIIESTTQIFSSRLKRMKRSVSMHPASSARAA